MGETAHSRVAVAVSGGVDSLCALLLLQQAGVQPLAIHGLFLPDAAGPPDGLAEACARLHVPLHVVDVRSVFRRTVLIPFAAAYAAGRTPNPCALCNREIKFGALQDAALALGSQKLATGHYARLVPGPEDKAAPPLLASAADSTKDQSYFLSLVPRSRLQHALFPLHTYSKHQCRSLVAAAGLRIPLPSESQDICFITSGDKSATQPDAYHTYLEKHWQEYQITPSGPGPVLLREADGTLRPLARHQGLWRYTEGQRKGLGIAHSEALYVLAKDYKTNALIVGPRAQLGITTCVTGPATVALAPEHWPRQLLARVRHRQQPRPARASLVQGRLCITLEEQQLPTAPGQIAALYATDGRVLAAGIIEQMA